MDYNRIDKDLKASLDSLGDAFEVNPHTLLKNPASIQKKGIDFTRNNPVKKPSHINVKDVSIKSSVDAYKIRLHVYQPDSFSKKNIILYFHGGGYVFGLPEQADQQMFQLSRLLKTTIVSVDYRLSPQYPFPIPVLDGYDALQWMIKKSKTELGVQSDNITVFGASAGGHLAAAVTQMAVDDKIKNIKHQFLLYPVIHNKLNTPSMKQFTDAPIWSRELAKVSWLHFLGKEKSKKRIRYADLTYFDQFHKLPQTTIVACELDPLRDEAIEYAQLLYQASVKTELWVVPGAVHLFDVLNSSINNAYQKFLQDRLLIE